MSPSTATATTHQQQRSKFTADVISAIEELEVRRINRSAQQLADAAWQKLQYDLPVLELTELQALLEHLRSSLHGKTSWPCYLLTTKALENITHGAKRSATFDPVLSDHEQKLQQLLDDAITSTLGSKASRASSSSSTSQSRQQQAHRQAQQQQEAELPSAQQLYQQLCAVLLLQYTAKVASLPEQEAWQLLIEYWPDSEQCDQQDAATAVEPQQQQQQQHTRQQVLDSNYDSAVLATLATAAAPSSTNSTSAAQNALTASDSTRAASTSKYVVQEAAVLDDDNQQYEDFTPVSTSAACSSSRQYLAGGPTPAAVHQPQQYSWPVLRHKLSSIAEHVHYSLLAYEPLWKQHQAAQHLLQLLRALGVHSQAEELQPMLHAYVGLLVDRLAAAPADLPLLQQLWEALGLTSGRCLGHSSCSGLYGTATKTRQQVLPSEAVLGFSVAASVWSQLQGASARSKLWRLMYDHLLPVLEQCLGQLAYNVGASNSTKQASTSSSSAQANGSATGAGQQQRAVLGEGFAHVLLLAHVVELLVLGRQGAVDVAAQLTQCGVMRSMVVLFGKHAEDAAAEPLRRALLLASCSSQQAASWVLAVPSVLQQLQQQAFQLHGNAEAHSAIWELLISRNNSSQAACQSGSVQCSQLQTLLALNPAVLSDIQRQVALLQLLVEVQKAAGRQQLWGHQVQQLLKQLASNIKELQGAASAATNACAVHPDVQSAITVNGSVEMGSSNGFSNGATAAEASQQVHIVESGDSQSCSDDEGKGVKATRRFRQQLQQQGSSASNARDAGDLNHRRSQQLQPAALKLIKQLLTSGGKTD